MAGNAELTVWCNAEWKGKALENLRQGLGRHRLIVAQKNQASNLVAGGMDPALAEADVAFGQPDPQQVVSLPRLKWVHLTSAGYTRYDNDDVRRALHARNGVLTNSSGVYDEPCAEHVMAMMLALARRLPDALEEQRGQRRWNYLHFRADSRLLIGQTVLLVGFGAIGRRLAELLAPYHMNVMAVRRKPTGDEPIPVHPSDEIDRLLPSADHVINILPHATSTEGFFTAERLAKLKPSAIFYNIGRGSTVDQDALIAALTKKQFAFAYIDVTTPEPLPPDPPLWTTPNCYVTPHTAGGHDTEYERLVAHFLANLRRYETGDTLLNRVF